MAFFRLSNALLGFGLCGVRPGGCNTKECFWSQFCNHFPAGVYQAGQEPPLDAHHPWMPGNPGPEKFLSRSILELRNPLVELLAWCVWAQGLLGSDSSAQELIG